MNITIHPGNKLTGSIGAAEALPLPGDKSISHRAALLAALAEGESQIDHFLLSGVTRPMLEALTALGVSWQVEGEGLLTTLRIQGCGMKGLKPPVDPIACGNSATTLRLLAGVLAAAGIPAVLDGSPGLRRRPMGRIITPLRQMGVMIDAAGGETAPLQLGARKRSQRLAALNYHLPVASAQVKTCLLLAGLTARDETMLWEPGPSRDHTERMLAEAGVEIAVRPPTISSVPCSTSGPWNIIWLHPIQADGLTPLRMTIPGDFSAAAFLVIAALITPGSQVTIRGTGLNPLRTGLLDALQSMGANVRVSFWPGQSGEPVGDLQVSYGPLRGTEVSGDLVVRMIDEFPIFAIAAAFAQGETVVRDAQELRQKESDRISALCAELRILGVEAVETPDGFRISGGRPVAGGSVQPSGDHRLAMSLAVAGLASQTPVTVQDAQVMSESFPGFITALVSLGASVEESAEPVGPA